MLNPLHIKVWETQQTLLKNRGEGIQPIKTVSVHNFYFFRKKAWWGLFWKQAQNITLASHVKQHFYKQHQNEYNNDWKGNYYDRRYIKSEWEHC